MYKLEEAVSEDLEAARILQRLEKTNEKLAENDGKWVFRANYENTSYDGRYSEEAYEYAEQYGEAAMHEKYPEEFIIKLYTCSGCEQAECDGYCLEDGGAFYTDAEDLQNGKGVEIYPRGYYNDNNSRLRHEVLLKYGKWGYPTNHRYGGQGIDEYAWRQQREWEQEDLLDDLVEFAEAKGVKAPSKKDVWFERRDIEDRNYEFIPSIHSTPEYADLVVEMLHFQAMKENESK